MSGMNPDVGTNVTGSSTDPGFGRPTSTPRRILIVDDNVDAADSLNVLLRLRGHATFVAYRAVDALVAFRSQPFDLALIDLRMPGVDGYQLVHRMRAVGVTLPAIVAVTGMADMGSRRKAKEAGFDHYLVKPYEIESMEAIVECRAELNGDQAGSGW